MIFALTQLNPTIGDFHANGEKIKQWAAKAAAAGATLAIFPELALSCYPPQDYLEHPAFLKQQDAVLEDLK